MCAGVRLARFCFIHHFRSWPTFAVRILGLTTPRQNVFCRGFSLAGRTRWPYRRPCLFCGLSHRTAPCHAPGHHHKRRNLIRCAVAPYSPHPIYAGGFRRGGRTGQVAVPTCSTSYSAASAKPAPQRLSRMRCRAAPPPILIPCSFFFWLDEYLFARRMSAKLKDAE